MDTISTECDRSHQTPITFDIVNTGKQLMDLVPGYGGHHLLTTDWERIGLPQSDRFPTYLRLENGKGKWVTYHRSFTLRIAGVIRCVDYVNIPEPGQANVKIRVNVA